MYYNKVTGLQLLDKALKGIKGVKTAVHHVLVVPEDVLKVPIPEGTKRILLRGNFSGNIPPGYWWLMPRREIKVEKLGEKREEIAKQLDDMKREVEKRKWPKDLTYPFPLPSTDEMNFHAVMHPLKERQAHPFSGTIIATPKLAFIELKKPKVTDKYWRNDEVETITFIPLKRNQVEQALQGILGEKSRPVATSLLKAFGAIQREVRESKLLKGSDTWESSFAIEQQNGEHVLEFYDFLHKPNLLPIDKVKLRSIRPGFQY